MARKRIAGLGEIGFAGVAILFAGLAWLLPSRGLPAHGPHIPDVVVDDACVGHVTHFTIPIANRAPSTLIILGAVETGICNLDGCWELHGFPLTIPPDHTASLAGEWRPKRAGVVRQPVTLVTNCHEFREVSLQLCLATHQTPRN